MVEQSDGQSFGDFVDDGMIANDAEGSAVVGQRRLTFGGMVSEVVTPTPVTQRCPPRQLWISAAGYSAIDTGTVGRSRPVGKRQVVVLFGARAVEVPHRPMPSVTLVYRNAKDLGLQVSHD